MKKKFINEETITGRVYEHDLTVKTVKKQGDNFGKEFIAGTISIAVDEDGLNVIPVHYTYIPPTTKNGGQDSRFVALKKIIDEGKTWLEYGKDEATKVRITGSTLDLNDFVSRDGTMVSVKRNENGFITIVNEFSEKEERNKFTVDMLITNVKRVEANEEHHVDKDYDIISGAIFNFRGDILPLDLVIKNDNGMNYFENLEATKDSPVLTKVWGRIISETIKNEIPEESAFGEASVKIVERKTKEWVVTGAATTPYEIWDESTLTEEEVRTAMQNREMKLAEVKRQKEIADANRGTSSNAFLAKSSTPIPEAKAGTFSF
jgi:hypothetical protein